MALTPAEIKKFMSDDMASRRKKDAEEGQRYYEGRHDILKYRLFYYDTDGNLREDTTRTNIKISHPFFTILTDQLAAYMLSFKENPIRAKDGVDGLQDHLDERFDDEFWAEISELITGASAKGFEYLYGFKNAENNWVFQCADSLGVVEVPAKDADDGQKHIIYHYADTIKKGAQEVRRIQDWTENEITYWVQVGGGAVKPDDSAKYNPRPHVVFHDETGQTMGKPFGFIPFWRLDYCKKQISALKPVKDLIDDYDLHACSLSNNLVDFDTPLHVVKGFEGHGEDGLKELQHNLKTKKIVGVDSEGGIDVKTVDVPYQARKEKLDIDERNIYIFGMGFNPGQIGDGNITNVVIRSRYTLLDLKANKLEKRLRKLLKDVIKAVLADINEDTGNDYQMKDIWFDFTRSVMTNETENIQNEKTKAETRQIEVNTILNIAVNVGDEQTLKALCEVMEWDFDEIKSAIKKAQEESLESAQETLEGVVTDEDETEVTVPDGAE